MENNNNFNGEDDMRDRDGKRKPTKKKHFLPTSDPPKSQHANYFLSEHRIRLSRLLEEFVKRHKWKEASGVLSVLLKGTSGDRYTVRNRKKYWAAMEILSKIGEAQVNPRQIRRLYEIWMSKEHSIKCKRKRQYQMQLEYALFHLTKGNIEEAHKTTIILVQDRESRSDALVNLVAGLIFYELWYSEMSKEMKIKEFETNVTPKIHKTVSSSDYNMDPLSDDISNNHGVVDAQDKRFSGGSDSHSSIGNCKNNGPAGIPFYEAFQTNEFHEREANQNDQSEAYSKCHDLLIKTSIFSVRGINETLLPANLYHCLEKFGDCKHSQYYNEAVKHLQMALHSSPPCLEALVPLIQLLLIGDHVDEALKELRNFSGTSSSIIPSRLRAAILDCFGTEHHSSISACHEELLKNNPTCSYSLSKLIDMHRIGNYKVESLLEMIALHLDATPGTCDIWREFSICFLKTLSMPPHCDNDDQFSSTLQSEDARVEGYSIPRIFTTKEGRHAWKFRCRWWANRHFSKSKHLAEVEFGDWQLLTFKAACAYHLYGRKFEYVSSVFTHLKQEEDKTGFLLLQDHIQCPVVLHDYLKDSMQSNKTMLSLFVS